MRRVVIRLTLGTVSCLGERGSAIRRNGTTTPKCCFVYTARTSRLLTAGVHSAAGTQTLSAAAISIPGSGVDILTRCSPAFFFGGASKTR